MKNLIYIFLIAFSVLLLSCNTNTSYPVKKGVNGGFFQQMENGKSVRFENMEYWLDTIDYISFDEVNEVQLKQEENKIDYSVIFRMSESGATKMHELSKNNMRKPLFVVVNEDVFSAPLIMFELPGEEFRITFNSEEEAQILIQLLKQ